MGFIKRLFKKFVVKKTTAVEVPVYKNDLLEGKRALILGGSGGIGSEIAKAFVESGAKVVVTGTKEEKLKNVCLSIGHEKASYVVADITAISEIQMLVEKAASILGQIDILVCSAGVHCHDPFGTISEQTWDNVMNVNLKSVYFACQIASNYMIENKIKGHILLVGSASGSKPGWTPYEISKNGVKALTLGFADKLIKHGIVVNCIAPGPVATQMLNRESNDDVSWAGNPTGRMCTPSEIANWAILMASDMGNMIVGDSFHISGGSGTICIDR
ncbi:MAG: SDR family oxidoreductase [Clostridia bacterium]|nr:SDR family oxidoreductase [Clostridia bacterium]